MPLRLRSAFDPLPRAVPALLATVLAVAACDPDASPVPTATLVPAAEPRLDANGELSATAGFRRQVGVAGIREHSLALQALADAHGARVPGSAGYDAAVEYVVGRMTAAGYDTRVQSYSFLFGSDATPPELQRISPNPATFVAGTDFRTMYNSGSGDVTGAVTAVDFVVPLPPDVQSTSGCEAADFAGFPAGNIALVQRGTCDFALKAAHARAAGASAVIVPNDGRPDRSGVFGGTLGDDPFSLPVVGTTFAVGEALRNGVLNGPTFLTARVAVDWVRETRTGKTVIAESRRGDPSQVILVGSALDADAGSPGINAASGAATALEIAEELARAPGLTDNRVRFVWLGRPANSPVTGASHYLGSLSADDKQAIRAALFFDWLGSPNYGRFVYDGDRSTHAASNPIGSAGIERVFTDYFGALSLAVLDHESTGWRNLADFRSAGIPVGGLFSGTGAVKSAELAALFGGTAGIAFDPCLGAPCDSYDNVSTVGLDELSDGAAHAVLTLAKRNLRKAPLTGP